MFGVDVRDVHQTELLLPERSAAKSENTSYVAFSLFLLFEHFALIAI
jgi:hypothetical protein